MSQVKLLPSEPVIDCCRFSLTEVLSVTKNFSDDLVIGKGGFGKVYKGFINNRATTVAIKRLNAESKQGARKFWTEIITLLKLRYTHLVTLIGYSDDEGEMILVYEYIPKGTLAEHLYRSSREQDRGDRYQLTWEQRLNICIGAALGLQYLHENNIIHRDVKTTNILLDEDLVAKIADFGLSKMTHMQSHVSTDIKGTFGYLDPEYFFTHRLTMKSDVYAFGVVLLEVVCAKPPVDTSFEEPERRSLAFWAEKCFKKGRFLDMIDPSLREQVTHKDLNTFTKIAINCLNKDSKRRPTMAQVVRSLKLFLELDIKANQQKGIVAGLSSSIARILRSDKPVNNLIIDISAREKPDKNVCLDTTIKSNSDEEVFLNIPATYKLEDSEHIFLGIPATCIRHFTMSELLAFTDHFNESKIIKGGYGYHTDVYRGLIDRGTLDVAIKRWTGGISHPQANILRMEIEVQSQLHDLNLVSLIGYYMDEQEAVLVYDYMANGSLHHHLYETKSSALSWEKRVKICLSIAQALQYLRTKRPSIYRYLMPTNIFLNQDWNAKISGFYYPNLTLNDINEKQYIDPESYFTGRFSEKSDVYSFGVLLLELLCGRSAMIYSKSEGTARLDLVKWFIYNGLHSEIDPYVSRPIAPECFKTYAELALCCLSYKSINCPTMKDVVIHLERALYQQKTWQDSEGESLQACRLRKGSMLESNVKGFISGNCFQE